MGDLASDAKRVICLIICKWYRVLEGSLLATRYRRAFRIDHEHVVVALNHVDERLIVGLASIKERSINRRRGLEEVRCRRYRHILRMHLVLRLIFDYLTEEKEDELQRVVVLQPVCTVLTNVVQDVLELLYALLRVQLDLLTQIEVLLVGEQGDPETFKNVLKYVSNELG